MLRSRLVAGVFLLLLCAGTAGAGLPTIVHEGRNYVELSRVADTLKTRLEAAPEGSQARLRAGTHIVTFTRNWSRILVDGTPVVLDGPVVIRKGVWLVPETFLTQVMPKIALETPALTLEEMRTRSYPSFTRIVLETSGPVAYRAEPGGPREARVRLLGLVGEATAESFADGFVEQARVERAGPDALLRVSFEGTPGELKVAALTDPPRLVLDFSRPGETAARERPVFAPLRTIVLDAGHGGHDSGAIGPGGLMEKDLVLDVTKRVARLLEDKLDVKVRLSRDSDSFVALRDRTSFANRERADLFVSIHANAHRVAASEGVEVYFLSSEATDSAARQVAATENSVAQLEKPANGKGAARADIVKSILWDLAQSEYQAESSRLAETVLDTMTLALRIPNRGVKQAGFYVLGGAAMPAILVEIGFVTNPKEEKRLKESRYRDEIARAIVSGLGDYKRTWDARARAAERVR
ncbi:MAG TPA: N-acetylmuramoyl-L-alanine amidase [Methylomirabilota bacterium]